MITNARFSKPTLLTLIAFFVALLAYTQTNIKLKDASQNNTPLPVPQSAQIEPLGHDTSFALIAGGSKGIGYALAQALAKRGYNLILIARHLDSLQAAKTKLETTYPVHVELLQKDLSQETAAEEVAQWCKERNIALKVLCNVAGFGGANDYLSPLPLDSLRYMVHLNIESAMTLSYTLLPLLDKNAPSYILNVASMAGLAPIPIKNLYSATKAAVLFFSYSLHYQLKDKNIHVSCLAPGPVFTKPEVIEDTKEKLGWFGVKMAVPPTKVGEIAVKKTLKGRMLIVPGTLAKITATVIRILPRRLITSIYYKVGKKRAKKSNGH